MGAEQSINTRDYRIDHVRNTFIDIDTRRFDKERVADPRKCKSMPSTPLRTPRKCQSLPSLLVPSNSRVADLDENSESVFRDDASCKTADPMDDQIQLDSIETSRPFNGFQVIVPYQTVQQFLEEDVPHVDTQRHQASFKLPNPGCTDLTWHSADNSMVNMYMAWGEQMQSPSYTDLQGLDMSPASWNEYDMASMSDLSPPQSPSRKKQASQAKDIRKHGGAAKVDRSTWTCRMLRNIPNDYSRGDLCEMLDANRIQYNFAYLPIDWGKRANLGYAFVNLISHEEAERVEEVLAHFSRWKVASEKVCEVAWAKQEQQSLELIVESFKNNPVMHPEVPEEFKPLLFNERKQKVDFPPPTKALRPPRGFLRKPVLDKPVVRSTH